MRKCIFCGKRADSKEHAWPNWLLKLLKRDPNEITEIHTMHDNEMPRKWHGVNAAIKFRNVCQKCNNGWMKELEDEASPILSLMIKGSPVNLTGLQQRTLAAWIIKTTMVFDSVKPQNYIFYDGLDGAYIRKELAPPSATLIWLGHYSGSDYSAFTNAGTFTAGGRKGSPKLIKGNIHTMAFGRVALQILSRKMLVYDPSLRVDINPTGGPWRDALITIWPVNILPLQWPPPLSFDDTGRDLEAFADRFQRPIVNVLVKRPRGDH